MTLLTQATIPVTRFTPDDLLSREADDALLELVDGQLVEKLISYSASKTLPIVVRVLSDQLEKTAAGEIVCECTFQCFPILDRVRRPDIAFIAADRAAGIPPEGHVRVAPDLVIEIISPGERINTFLEKVADYRSAGVKLVWELNPTFRYIRIHRLDRTETFLLENDTVTGEGVLPGFSATVKELMPAK